MKNTEHNSYKDWRNFKRNSDKAKIQIPTNWKTFAGFNSDMKEKPSKDYYLFIEPLDDPSVSSNYRWRKALGKPNREHPEYLSWKNMRSRCYSACIAEIRNYQTKGITVCDRWLDFHNFYEDMGPRPTNSHSIDRIDNDKGYSPDNCRWATDTEQNRNKGNVRTYTYRGITGCIPELAIHFDINANSIHKSLQRGDSIELTIDRLLQFKLKI